MRKSTIHKIFIQHGIYKVRSELVNVGIAIPKPIANSIIDKQYRSTITLIIYNDQLRIDNSTLLYHKQQIILPMP